MSNEIQVLLASIDNSLHKIVALLSISASLNPEYQDVVNKLMDLYRTKRSIEHQIFAISLENRAALAVCHKLDETSHMISQLRADYPAVSIYFDILFGEKDITEGPKEG